MAGFTAVHLHQGIDYYQRPHYLSQLTAGPFYENTTMTCLISVTRSGKYCCIEAPQTGDELRHIDLNEGALVFKQANLPETVLLCKVDKEWVDSGITVGGDSPCTVVCKPGAYKLDIACSDYNGMEAPDTDPVELCFEVDKNFDKLAYFMEQASQSTATEAILDCLAELKLLTAANNDAVALATIISQLQELCEKLLSQAEQTQAICDKLEAVIDQLNSLCEKIAQGNEDQLTCLEEIKQLLTCPPATARGVLTTW